MIELLEKTLKDNWGMISPDSDVPNKINFLYKSGFRKYIMVAFSDHSFEPIGIGYLTNEDIIIKRMENQYLSLKRIHEHNDVMLKNFVPKPLIWERIRGHQILFISNIEGKPLIIQLKKKHTSRQEIDEIFKLGEDWLVRLHNMNFGISKTLKEVLIERNLQKDLSCFNEDDLLQKIPIVLKHGDFQSTNLLYIKEQKFNAIDWEYSGDGLPLYDLFYFLSHTVKQLKRAGAQVSSLSKTIHHPGDNFNIPNEEDFKDLFFSKSENSVMIGKIVGSFCSKIHLEPKLIPILFYLFLHDFHRPEFLKNFVDMKDQFIFYRT